MTDSKDTIITGVGGQGNVLAAKLLASAALADGYEVSVGDVYGLSQRGGSVASHVRWNRKRLQPPLVRKNSLDLLLAFEPLEALRVLSQYGNDKTVIVVNNFPVEPVGVQSGRFVYPDVQKIFTLLEKSSRKIWWVPATETAKNIGNIQFLNTVMLGALCASGQVGFAAELFEEVILKTVSSRYASLNIEAFRQGRQLCLQNG